MGVFLGWSFVALLGVVNEEASCLELFLGAIESSKLEEEKFGYSES